MELLKQQIEALIFCSEQSISLEEIAASLKISFEWELEDQEILEAIAELKEKYKSEEFSFELAEISEGFQFLTKKQYHVVVSALIQHKSKKKLSVSQMETLAIIAYRQPVSKGEVEHIRGVSCDYAIQKLLEKELIEISGKSDGPGRPVLYSTSRNFMDYFGIKTVRDLPQLKDLHVEQNEIGQPMDGEASSDIPEYPVPEEALAPENVNTEEISPISITEEEITIHADVRDDENWELPDRKTIFIENELSNSAESTEEQEKDDKEDFL